MSSVEQYLGGYADREEVVVIGPLVREPVVLTEPVIFVDGGAVVRRGKVGRVVGDGDSYSGVMDHKLNPEKDFSDLAFALNLLPENFTTISLLGFLGGRRDHELLNLGEVFHFLKSRSQQTSVRLDNQVFAYSAGKWSMPIRGIFSLVAFEPTRVTMSGHCKYPIPANTLISPVSSFGLSNEADGEVHWHSDAPLHIFIDASPTG